MKEVKFEKGLDEEKVRKISELKNEPEWMLEYRLKSYKDFTNKSLPSFGPKINIDFNNITYYKRIDNEVHNSWNSVDKNVKKTFDDIGVIEQEKEYIREAYIREGIEECFEKHDNRHEQFQASRSFLEQLFNEEVR